MTQYCGFPDSDNFIATNYPLIKICINSLGLLCAVIVVLLVTIFFIFSPELIDRVTLRLQAAISLIDIIRHIAFFFSCHKDADSCPIIGFLRFFGDHIYFLLNISIAFNMQLIFIHKLHPSSRWEKRYWICSIFLPLTIDTFLFAMSFFGRTKSGVCLIKAHPYAIAFRSIHITFSYLTTLYCLCVACYIILRLKKQSKPLDFMSKYLFKHNLVSRDVVKARILEIVSKSTYYPLACFFSLFFYNIYLIIEEFKDVYSIIILLTMVGLSFTGVLNLFAFLSDPFFKKAFISTQVVFMNRFGLLANINNSKEETCSGLIPEQVGQDVVNIYIDSSCLPYSNQNDNDSTHYNDEELMRDYVQYT